MIRLKRSLNCVLIVQNFLASLINLICVQSAFQPTLKIRIKLKIHFKMIIKLFSIMTSKQKILKKQKKSQFKKQNKMITRNALRVIKWLGSWDLNANAHIHSAHNTGCLKSINAIMTLNNMLKFLWQKIIIKSYPIKWK